MSLSPPLSLAPSRWFWERDDLRLADRDLRKWRRLRTDRGRERTGQENETPAYRVGPAAAYRAGSVATDREHRRGSATWNDRFGAPQ
jgi:hypothetical protein